MDHLPEEFKSAEYKAFEAFLKANHGTLHDMACDRSRNYMYPSTHTPSHSPLQPPLLLMILTSLDKRTQSSCTLS